MFREDIRSLERASEETLVAWRFHLDPGGRSEIMIEGRQRIDDLQHPHHCSIVSTFYV